MTVGWGFAGWSVTRFLCWQTLQTGFSSVAGVLLAIGVGLWALTWATNRGLRGQRTEFKDVEHLSE